MTVAPNLLNPLSEQSSVIDGLRPWTAYNITVLCFTSPGDGIRSPPELVRTHQVSSKNPCHTQSPNITSLLSQDYPGPVSHLRFEDVTDRGVRVLWDRPRSPNGILTGYTVRYMVKDLIHTLAEKNLTAGTRYGGRNSRVDPISRYFLLFPCKVPRVKQPETNDPLHLRGVCAD